MTEIKKELEAIHSIKSKGAGDEEEFVLGQHYPPGVVGMKELVKCWEYHLKENKKLKEENKELRLQAFGVNCNMTGEGIILKPPTREDYIVMVDELKEENKELHEELRDWRVNFKEEKEERIKLSRELLKYTKGWVEKDDKGKITKRHHSYKRLQELYDKYSPHRNKIMKEFQLVDDD